ncbi:unnamed protein product [Lathyrus oleraceus]
MVSGINNNLENPIGKLFTKHCLIGDPRPPPLCCISRCPNTNCRPDCIADGFIKGGFCTLILDVEMCCCYK